MGTASDDGPLRLSRAWLLPALLASRAVLAVDPQQSPPPQHPSAPAPAAAAAAEAPPPDESLFEFLGADDVGDAGWWEYLQHADPKADTAPAVPQDDRR